MASRNTVYWEREVERIREQGWASVEVREESAFNPVEQYRPDSILTNLRRHYRYYIQPSVNTRYRKRDRLDYCVPV